MTTRTARPVAALLFELFLVIGLWLFLLACVSGCKATPRHQKGGGANQSFPQEYGDLPSTFPPASGGMGQSLTQPENPDGKSSQSMTEERTEVRPDGTVIRTVRHAGTELGGSQDLADILKEYAASDYFRRIALGLVLGVIAFAVRKDWPSLQWVFGIGAVAVAFFGPLAVLGVAGAAGGLIAAYYIVSARFAALAAPLP